MKNLFRTIVMFIVGFMAYITIEVMYRGYSYIAMGTMGGVVFILLDLINEIWDWDTDLSMQALIGGAFATMIELLYGLFDVYVLGFRMWDYSDQPFNLMGIICPQFSIYWILLSVIGILIADFINYCLFRNSTIPYYYVFGKKYTPGIYKFVD